MICLAARQDSPANSHARVYEPYELCGDAHLLNFGGSAIAKHLRTPNESQPLADQVTRGLRRGDGRVVRLPCACRERSPG
jgi:hypothetical protein